MSSMFYVVCIVAIACGTAVITDYFKTRRKEAERRAGSIDDDMLAQLRALEERVRVLERIVTERKYDLEREINSL